MASKLPFKRRSIALDLVRRHDVRSQYCGSNWMPKNGNMRGQQMYKRGDCKKKHTADAVQTHFPEHAKRQARQARIEGTSISATARIVGAIVTSVRHWLGQEAIALERLRVMSARRMSGRAATIADSTIDINESRTYASAIVGEKHNNVWVWTVDAPTNLLAPVFAYKIKLNNIEE